MAKSQVLIIGAGIAGLSAAYFLKQKGISFSVLEASERVGGRVMTMREQGLVIDAGSQFISSSYGVLPNLIKQLGLQSQVVDVSEYSAIVRDGKARRMKASDPFSLVSAGIISLPAFTQFAATVGVERLKTAALPLEDYSAWHQMDDADAYEWSIKNIGEEVYNYLIEPTFEALYFQSPKGSSRAFATAVSMFPARGQTIFALKGGNGMLASALAEIANVKLGKKVAEIKEEGDGVVAVTESGETFEGQFLILAVTSSNASKLFKTGDAVEERLMATKYSTTLNIAYGTGEPVGGLAKQGIYGIWVPKKERTHISAIAVESNKNRDRKAKGECINVMLPNASGHELIDKSEEEILAAITPELERYFPAISKKLIFTKIFRWREAEPLSPIGRSKDLHTYRTDKKSRRIFLAGDFMSMPWTDGAAESGMWAAKAIAPKVSR
jgi:protoporphyrinogen/coproporphyrinogen III oxidase